MRGWRRSGLWVGLALLVGAPFNSAWSQKQPPALHSLYKQSVELYQAGKYSEAVPVVQQYIDIAASRFGEFHPVYADGLGSLGTIYQALNRSVEAEQLFKRALLIKEKALGSNHLEVADAIHDLAELYRKQGRLSEAEPLYQRALSILEKALGPEHTSLGIVLGHLAEVYDAQGRHAEAEPLAKRSRATREGAASAGPTVAAGTDGLPSLLLAQLSQLYQADRLAEAMPIAEHYLQIIEVRLGTQSPEYAVALSNLAQLLQATSRLSEAEPLFRRALAIDEESLGPEHPIVAVNLNNLAQLLRATNRLAEAELLIRRALAIDEKSLGPEHPNVAASLNNLAELFRATNRLVEAEPLYRRALAIDEKSFGPEHPNVARDLNDLALMLQATNRMTEAEPLMRRALAVDEKSRGPHNPNVARDLNNLAQLLQATNRVAEAEPLMRRALAIDEKNLGAENFYVALKVNNLAGLLQATNRLAEAEPLMRRALAIDEKNLGTEHPDVARDLTNLAALLQGTNRLAEAEPLMRRALAIDEKSFGPEHPNVAKDLNNLALLLHATSRLVEVEPLHRRALSIVEKSLGPEHPNVAASLNNLAELFRATNRLVEAEPLYRRALAIDEKFLGPEHPNVARDLNNLALLLQATNRLVEAEPPMRRVIAIFEKSLGGDHPNVATALNNLAMLLQASNRTVEAEPLLRRALVIFEKSLGADHPNVATALINLATLSAERGDWAGAAAFGQRAKPILIAHRDRDFADRTGLGKVVLAGNSHALRSHAQVVYRADPSSDAAREEAFELAQWALQTGAADALSQMSVRFAKDTGQLASLVRLRQDLVARREREMRLLDAAAGRADSQAGEDARIAVAALDQRLDTIDAELLAGFPEYAALSNPKPLTIAATRTLLKPDEALVLFLNVSQRQLVRLPEETLAWVITKETVRWHSIPLGTRALSDQIGALRCGLDASSWDDTDGWPQRTALDMQRILEQRARRDRCKQLLGLEVSPHDWPPFDLARAHDLYQALLAPFGDLTKDKHLIIVPSGPLTTLPFHALITAPPDPALPGMVRYRQAAWLALQQPITVLPSVGSLQVLRRIGPSQAKEPYIAFGNPLLVGPDGNDMRAWAKQQCTRAPARKHEALPIGSVSLRAIDLAELRLQAPLPETADELCAVAEALGSLRREQENVWLGERATEHNLKALSREGKLANYRVVHFATHGLLSGESEAILKAKAEPGLILTPPKDGRSAAELEEDDGLLTASEVAQLELDADWVVLSACNTAAGENGDAEALSGLARAFFYAKARALLVSHWSVRSDAAVKLTTKAFAELKAHPEIGRAEALRRSMVELIQYATADHAHPAVWAPFVLVGEGGDAHHETALVATPAARSKKRVTAPDWRTEVWRQ
jgi:CHAT domain-containing protein/Tfp pilus assembly protein PilF